MNPEVKEKWITALESGEYSQTKDCLRDENGYCCLGVLVDVAIKDGLDLSWKDDYGYVAEFHTEDGYIDREESVLPEVVVEWAGLDSKNPMVKVEDDSFMRPISDPNDNGMPFPGIAKLIREQL